MTNRFEKFLKEIGETQTSVCEKMAKVMLELDGHIVNENITEQDFEKLVKEKTKYYKPTVSRYTREENPSVPELQTAVIIALALKKDLNEIAKVFYPELYLPSLNNDSCGSQNKNVENLPEEISQPQIILPLAPVHTYNYHILEVEQMAEYTKSRLNTLKYHKKFKLQALEDGLVKIENFDYIKCLRNDQGVEMECPDAFVKTDIKHHLGSDEISVDIIFHKPLQKDQIVEFTLSYFCKKVLNRDIGFHCTWTLHPTDKLILKVIPPDPVKNNYAKYRVHKFKGCPRRVEEEIKAETKDIWLQGEPKCFQEIISHPVLFTTCGFYWDREYW